MPETRSQVAQSEDVKSEEMLLNMGPQHPSTHGVFRVVIRSDGEIIIDAESHIGYLHRCFEKICENVNYLKATPYTDRLDYLMAMGNNLGYSLSIERLMDVEIPERASVHPRHRDRAQSHRFPPARDRDLRDGHRRHHAVPVLLP